MLYTYTCIKKRRATRPTPWKRYALAGVVTLTMVPFTWLIMVPTNNELFRRELVTRAGKQATSHIMAITDAKEMVIKWSWMHLTRSFFPLIGAVIGAVGICRNA
jgi:hypothetical protein